MVERIQVKFKYTKQNSMFRAQSIKWLYGILRWRIKGLNNLRWKVVQTCFFGKNILIRKLSGQDFGGLGKASKKLEKN